MNNELNSVPLVNGDMNRAYMQNGFTNNDQRRSYNEEDFHAKATKKADGAKTSLNLIKNATKVANVCADVIGDICRSYKWGDKCNASNKNRKYI